MNLPAPIPNDDSRHIIGESEPIQVVLRQVEQVAPTKATVLITGETGVGKDVIAEAIHESSPRKNRPFKAVNCGAFYQDLLQSELFGHEKGAFTGASSQRRGVFEQANKGTLFLDEVGEMSPEVQVKFLRVLETQEFTRLGGEKNITVDVRIIAATNINLAKSVRERKFRQDLYYRLNLFRIHIPPLRDRREDIPLFIDAFISEISAAHGKTINGITPEARYYLQNADWRGNVRQLKNAVESAIIVATTDELRLQDFPIDIESEQIAALLVQVSGTQLTPTQIIGTETPAETALLNPPGTALQVIDTATSALTTENIAVYKTILGLIFSAIRSLDPTSTASDGVPSLIPDEDTSWLQVSEADDAADILRKTLEVLSAIAKVLENRNMDGSLATLASQPSNVPIVTPLGSKGEAKRMEKPLALLDDEVIGKVGMTMAEIERAAIQKTLAETAGNKTEAARILDIGVRTLHRKLDAYRQEADDGSDGDLDQE